RAARGRLAPRPRARPLDAALEGARAGSDPAAVDPAERRLPSQPRDRAGGRGRGLSRGPGGAPCAGGPQKIHREAGGTIEDMSPARGGRKEPTDLSRFGTLAEYNRKRRFDVT